MFQNPKYININENKEEKLENEISDTESDENDIVVGQTEKSKDGNNSQINCNINEICLGFKSFEVDFPKNKNSTTTNSEVEDKNEIMEEPKNLEKLENNVDLVNGKKKSIKFKDGRSQHFEKEHIQGIHNPRKKRNHKADFQKAKYKPVMKYEVARGDVANQVMMVTKKKLPYEETGLENLGEKGEAYFLVAGPKNGKRCQPQHVYGRVFKQPDGR